MNTKQKILGFMDEHDECVIATTGKDGEPQAATVGYSSSSDLELTIGTSKGSRKYENIQSNPNVAVVVGFKGNITVQYQGVARRLEGDELNERKKVHFKKIPGAKHFERYPDQVYLSISPTWIRYTDYSQPEPVEELREFI